MPKPISPDLVYHIIGVGSPALSSDGRMLAFTRTVPDPEKMTGDSHIMVIRPTDGGEPVRFTSGPNDALPSWSPDGSTLAFLRNDSDGKPQMWMMRTTGGEARQVTRLPEGVAEFSWGPDSRSIVAAADVPPETPPPTRPGAPRTRTVTRVHYRYDSVGWRGDMYRHLFVIDTLTGEERRLTDGPHDDIAPVWSPDGARIAFISGRGEDADFTAKVEAYVIPALGGEPERWSGELEAVSALGWSPDGRRLCAVGTDIRGGHVGPLVYQGRVYILSPDAAPVPLTDTGIAPAGVVAPQHRGVTLRWTPDDRIVFLAVRHGVSGLYEAPVAGGEVRRVGGDGCALSDLTADAAGRRAAAVISTPTSPSELWTTDIETGQDATVTGYNRGWLDAHPAAGYEKFTLQRNGVELECRVMHPPGFDPTSSRRYPMILEVHGGPNAYFADNFVPHHQVLAGAGYVVLAVNPRGSSTYGEQFMVSVFGDWGGEDCQDLLAAVDEMASRSYIDPERMGIHGYSYGGFMTTWMIGHTSRFKAAVAGAPVTDLVSMYGTSDIGVSFGEVHWGGTRADEIVRFLEHSPINYADAVETPLLLMHGETDVRVPMEQSEQYFVALKRLGKTVEFVRFPDCSHLFLRAGHPALREEYYARMLGWFDRHLRD